MPGVLAEGTRGGGGGSKVSVIMTLSVPNELVKRCLLTTTFVSPGIHATRPQITVSGPRN